MKNFTTEQLYNLYNQFKPIFSSKKNISKDFQKIYFKITSELLYREMNEILPNVDGSLKKSKILVNYKELIKNNKENTKESTKKIENILIEKEFYSITETCHHICENFLLPINFKYMTTDKNEIIGFIIDYDYMFTKNLEFKHKNVVEKFDDIYSFENKVTEILETFFLTDHTQEFRQEYFSFKINMLNTPTSIKTFVSLRNKND